MASTTIGGGNPRITLIRIIIKNWIPVYTGMTSCDHSSKATALGGDGLVKGG
jgi:hypothetical protein